MVLSRVRQRDHRKSRVIWFERIVAAIALVNLILVLFDLSYIRFRDHYLQVLPEQTVWYGERFKGIEPDRTTQRYLFLVDSFEEVAREGDVEGVKAQQLLAALQASSTTIIDEDPFAVAGKSGTLARVKNLMRDRMRTDSAKKAFSAFWNERHLQPASINQELIFFNTQVRPLIESNYFRGIGESGSPIDLFWQIDAGFMAFFAIEFLLRTYGLSRRYPNTTWPDAMLWRIYDVPLFVGFWRWLRIIPVTLRLHQAQVINLEPVRNRISRAIVSQFAVELTEIVLLRTIDQMQQLVKDGNISRWLVAATDQTQYVDINGVDEVQTITKHLADVMVYKVLPKVKPELDSLMQHSVVGALHQAPAYQGLKFMPGFEGISAQIARQVVTELSRTLTDVLQNIVSDEKGAALTSDLIASFSHHLRIEMQSAETMDEVRDLVNDLLEEIKINYVERIAGEDIEQMQEARYRLYGSTQRR